MQLFFSIWEFRSQQISSSTENIYLLKSSVIFYDSTTSWRDRGKNHERELYDIWGRELTGPIGKEFYVHSVGFKSVWMLCIGGDRLRWCGAVMAVVYRGLWESHECPTWDLSIPEVEPYLCDKKTMVPTGVTKLYAFLILAHKSRKWNCSSWRALAPEFRL